MFLSHAQLNLVLPHSVCSGLRVHLTQSEVCPLHSEGLSPRHWQTLIRTPVNNLCSRQHHLQQTLQPGTCFPSPSSVNCTHCHVPNALPFQSRICLL